MIFLQVVTNTTSNWKSYLQDANQIAQIIGTIMVVIYVVYTYKTFRQIKKQTDYQQDAYLKVEPIIIKDLTSQTDTTGFQILEGKIVYEKQNLTTQYLNTDLSNKLTGILKPIFNFEDNLFEGNFYTVILTNYGNAEVNKIVLKVTICVLNSKELIDKRMLREKETQELKIEIPEIVGRNGGKLRIPLLPTAAFPFYNISLQGEYFDVRNKKYIINNIELKGQNNHFHKLPT